MDFKMYKANIIAAEGRKAKLPNPFRRRHIKLKGVIRRL